MGTRRAENAEQTRRAILEAARRLFTEQGYFATKVGDIAAEARVSVAWVHAAGGGKSGLLRALIENGVDTDDNAAAVAHLATISDPAALVGFLITATRQRFEVWSGLMRQVAAAAPQDDGVREIQEIAHEGLRGALRVTADRLAEMGALRDGVDARHATDLLWLHLSNTAYFLRTDELGWTLDESEKWLHQAVPAALFTP
ncbi:TetR/AcrR family transcriptional regulator [Actinoplanes sp. NBRC 101535]|uniref:TetR/AcrR family transcriptional regulator n=1 Tax=Actinoplanes sp. NBRC 101535 TaxID=3032196 RepID=UPI0024A1B5DF|nr:TetR/AcrR family transcriptional regulator [Actinoplanes sp. NBRC 101535]GLY03754.1 hypothetical protein Acsp01_41330 [Actinoplanes sp. NBRC 101535]